MKSLFFTSVLLAMVSCHHTTAESPDGQVLFTHATVAREVNLDKTNADTLPLYQLFQLVDAERILGENAHLNDSSLKVRDDANAYQSAYVADAEDAKTGKTGAVYFMVEICHETNAAGQVYTSIRKANQDHGIEIIEDLGDEAYFHSDDENFMMIMARKENKVIRLKVNKITSHTSRDEFNIVAKEIIAKL